MNAIEFCSNQSNVDSYYCMAYDIIGPLPKQYDFVYGIGSILIFSMFLLCIYAIISILKGIRG